jgi:hypothetical protein
MPDSYDNFLI